MQKLWDSIRWRPLAAFYICWWLCRGAPMKCFEGFTSRWEVVKFSWRSWEAAFMFKHNRARYIPLEEWLKSPGGKMWMGKLDE